MCAFQKYSKMKKKTKKKKGGGGGGSGGGGGRRRENVSSCSPKGTVLSFFLLRSVTKDFEILTGN